jgi:hypothetical protein
MLTAPSVSRSLISPSTPSETRAIRNLGLVKALSKAGRLRYHPPAGVAVPAFAMRELRIRDTSGFHTLSGEIPAIRATFGVTLLPHLVPTQPPAGVTVQSGLSALSER